MNFGKIVGESFETYFDNTCVGGHRLNDALPRPSVYYAKYIAKTAPERSDTSALLFGRLIHTLALEGEAVMLARFAVAPEGIDRRTKQGKEDWLSFCADSAGRQIVKQEDVDLAWEMTKSIRAKPSAVQLLERGGPEITFRHQLPFYAVQARIDWWDEAHPAGPMCVNLKSVETLEDFDKQYANYHYYRGDAFQRLVVAKVLGVEPFVPQMVNLVVEKSAPYECEVRVPDAEALEVGARECMQRLTTLARCYESGVWPGASDAPRGISLPAWMTKALAEGRTP